ncbi:uncharacterized protein METZ01_LOCUS139474, partial [marine metagenome]
GICQQLDTPDTIYRTPANRFVAQFMGKMNLLEGSLVQKDGQGIFRHTDGLSVILSKNDDAQDAAYLAVRPQSISLSPEAADNTTSCTIRDRQFKGASIEYLIDVQGMEFIVIESSKEAAGSYQSGEKAWVHIAGEDAILLKD